MTNAWMKNRGLSGTLFRYHVRGLSVCGLTSRVGQVDLLQKLECPTCVSQCSGVTTCYPVWI